MIHAYIILLFVYLFVYLLYLWMNLWRSEGNFGDLVVSFHHQFEGLELRLCGLATGAFTHWATSPAPDV